MAVYEQVGRTLTQDKSGKKTLTVTYLGDGVASAASISGGSLYSTTVVSSESGTIKTIYQYDLTTAGSVTTAGGNIVGIEFVGSLRTEPLEAHPRYGELTAEERKAVKDYVDNPVSGSKALPDAWSAYSGSTTMGDLATKMLEGQTSFLQPSIILRKTYFSSSIPAGLKLGKTKDPGIDYFAQAKPTQNWLLISVTARGQSSTGYTVVEEYELSGENGWDPDLYAP